MRHRSQTKRAVLKAVDSTKARSRCQTAKMLTALPVNERHRSGQRESPKDSPATMPWHCVKTMMCDGGWERTSIPVKRSVLARVDNTTDSGKAARCVVADIVGRHVYRDSWVGVEDKERLEGVGAP